MSCTSEVVSLMFTIGGRGQGGGGQQIEFKELREGLSALKCIEIFTHCLY